MTRRSTFKKRVRSRMQKTGERYAAARLALLQKAGHAVCPVGASLLPGYQALPGVHPDTAFLTSALRHAGVLDPATGEPFTEVKLFGLSGGIGFLYFLFEYKGYPPMLTFSCRSWTTPWPVVGKALEHAGISHDEQLTGGAKTAARQLEAALDAGRVAHVTADYASLPWSGADAIWRGQMGRQLNVVGQRDGDYVVDTGALRVISRADLAQARGAVKKEKNRLVTFAPGTAVADPSDAVRAALAHTVKTFTEAPFKHFAGNFGLAGLEKAARLVGGTSGATTWGRVFHSGPLAFRALARTFECAMIELTPPAGGRPFYAQFLNESAALPGLAALAEAAKLVEKSGTHFEALAQTALTAGGDSLARYIDLSEEMDDLRRNSADASVGATIRALRTEQASLAQAFDLDAFGREKLYAQLASHFEDIASTETQLIELLTRIARS